MNNLINEKRTEQIIKFLNSLNINSKRFDEIINKKDKLIIRTFDEAFTHSSANKFVNYETIIRHNKKKERYMLYKITTEKTKI